MQHCPLCASANLRSAFKVEKMPVFPNMVFASAREARNAPVGEMTLTICDDCGFVFNQTFDERLLNFDQQYDNEQKHSPFYQQYLEGVIALLQKEVPTPARVAEIGCGKGFFLELLLKKGYDALGFDPSYEGDNPNIVKDYFSELHSTEEADLLVLRHMLYTVINPFALLHTIAKANQYRGKIYIEVLDFEWIVENNSFCDICYEQVVYFTKDSLSAFFEKSRVGNIFGGQYIYLIADLADLRPVYMPHSRGGKHLQPHFEDNIARYRNIATRYHPLAVWGAGGKGVSFTHLIDKGEGIVPFLIDINPSKQNQYIAPHGQKVLPPREALLQAGEAYKSVFVVNANYLNEIKSSIDNDEIEVLSF